MWYRIDDPEHPAPKDGTFLVWLAEPHRIMGSNVGVMKRHPKISFINGMMAFDLPKPTHWQPLPEPPTEQAEPSES